MVFLNLGESLKPVNKLYHISCIATIIFSLLLVGLKPLLQYTEKEIIKKVITLVIIFIQNASISALRYLLERFF